MVGSDEYYTPVYGILPILKYVRKESIIWCPFDTEESNFVKVFKANKHTVISSHLSHQLDFFRVAEEYSQKCDYIISNPPHSKMTDVLNTLFQIHKPFAMLLSISRIFDSRKRFELFRDHGFELLIFDRRINFLTTHNNQKPKGSSPFLSAYVCHNLLPSQVMFEELDRNIKDLIGKHNGII